MISFIVPVYNVEKYLPKCIQSILEQTSTDFEIILVDDGSTDNSFRICQEYSEKYANIKSFTKINEGQGQARNYGLMQSSGKYIAYIDADDYLETDMVGDCIAIMEASAADFMNFGIRFVEEGGRMRKNVNYFDFKSITGVDIFLDAMLDKNILTVCWNKVYKKSFLIENEILFSDIRINEDILYSRLCSFHARKTVFTDSIYYNALVRSGSTSRKMHSGIFLDSIRIVNCEKELFGPYLKNAGYSHLMDAHIIKFFTYLLVQAAFRVRKFSEFRDCFQFLVSLNFNLLLKNPLAIGALSKKTRVLAYLCQFPVLLRILAIISKRTFIYQYIY